jgi:hypothetical protein
VNVGHVGAKAGPSAQAMECTASWASAGQVSQSGNDFLSTASFASSFLRTRSSIALSVSRRSVMASQAV